MGGLRIGVRQHTFLGGNFFVLRLLNEYRNDLSVSAMPAELTAEANGRLSSCKPGGASDDSKGQCHFWKT